ncbi:NAD+ diphosphatase [Aureococcus anophagefferens]|nr:NAD+ diphosphatase [Aureococcus anophagefferens]
MVALLALMTQAAAFTAPFFDTSGRLQRTTAPPAPDPAAETRYVPIYKGEVLMDDAGAKLLEESAAAPYAAQDGCVVAWLGSATEGALAPAAPRNYWLLELSHLEDKPEHLGKWAPLRNAGGVGGRGVLSSSPVRVADDVAALLGTARGLADWHAHNHYCASCGGLTKPERHGRNRQCVDCDTRVRPRLDPSVIVLVTNERRDRCLLGRAKGWAPGRWSTLAGFVEFGESLEECVVREIAEEAGVAPDRASLRQVASQPWLFPRSLMVGYEAVVDDAIPLARQEDELAGLAWFDRDYVRKQVALQGDEDAPATPGDFHAARAAAVAATEARADSAARSAWDLVDDLEQPASFASLEEECAIDDADEKCRKLGRELAELDALIAQGPGKSSVREAAKNLLREIESGYDDQIFKK